MDNKLRNVNLSKELVWDFAQQDFRELSNGEELESQKGWVQTDWKIGAEKDISRLNSAIDTLNAIKYPWRL